MAFVIVTAAGSSRRFGGRNKLLQPLLGRPVLAWTLAVFEASSRVAEVYVTAPESDVREYERLLGECCPRAGRGVVVGSLERQQSIFEAVRRLQAADDTLVAVHDGARPLLTLALLESLLAEASRYGCGAIPGYTPTDTIKRTDGAAVCETPDRSRLAAVQTPQVFPFSMLRDAHAAADREGFTGTDDASLVERRGGQVRIVPGDPDNIKVTTPRDLWLAERLLTEREDAWKDRPSLRNSAGA